MTGHILTATNRRVSIARTLEEALDFALNLERGLKGGSNLGDELQVELAVLKLSD